jgi:hypothetical protein
MSINTVAKVTWLSVAAVIAIVVVSLLLVARLG